jgi:hypothetical protein
VIVGAVIVHEPGSYDGLRIKTILWSKSTFIRLDEGSFLRDRNKKTDRKADKGREKRRKKRRETYGRSQQADRG